MILTVQELEAQLVDALFDEAMTAPNTAARRSSKPKVPKGGESTAARLDPAPPPSPAD